MDSDSSLTELSSDLSSVGSMSPIPDYPSPSLTQDTENSEIVLSQSNKRGSDTEDQPARKKRKRPEPKPRTKDVLDLTGDLKNLETEQRDGLHKLLQVLRKRRKIVVIAGAGISVSAGIPDFRSSTGLFKTLKGEHKLKASGKQLFDASVYQTDSATSSFHDMVRQLSEQVSKAKPTAFHEMLGDLSLNSRLLRLYTQNVDGLDVGVQFLHTEVPLSRKGPWPPTIQVHGGLEKMACSKCSAISDFAPELFNGPDPPPCPACVEADRIRTDQAGKRSHGVGRLRPRMALYNERTPDEDAIGAVMAADLKSRPDALIVVGTSLKIPGVKRLVREMCGVIRDRRDGLTIWMNMDPPPLGKEFEDCWDLVVKGPCDAVADQWQKSFIPKEPSTSDTEKESVQISSKKMAKINGALPTPSASPSGSDVETKPLKIKLNVKKPEILSDVKIEKDLVKKAGKVSKTKRVKPLKQPKKTKLEHGLKSTYKVTKPNPTLTRKFKIRTPKKETVSSPLSSPQLPSWTPTPRTPSKVSPSKTQIPHFPGLLKYSPYKPKRSFIEQRGPQALPPIGLNFRSSPPPHEPLSSPVRSYPALSVPIPPVPKSMDRPVHKFSRPGSSSSMSETVSPTSIPKGMRDLID